MSFSELFSTRHKCREVEVEVTNQCNAKCVHCPPTRKLDSPSFMSMNTFKIIMEKYNEYYTNSKKPRFTFGGGGEPLLNKNLDGFIELCSKYGYEPHLITNANLLNQERLESLVKSGIKQINISIHAITPKEYHAAMGLDFNVTMKNILMARDYLKKNNITNVKLVILCNELSVVKSSQEEIADFWKKNDLLFSGQKPIWNRAGNLKNFDKIIKKIDHHTNVNFELPVWCLVLKYMDIICSNGDFIKCSCDFFGASDTYGNIYTNSLEEIYLNWQKILEKREKLNSCKTCIKSPSEIFFNELSGFLEV